jgi:hypothetical protein
MLFEAVAREGDQFRLLGIQCSNLVEGTVQSSLFDAEGGA